MRKKEHAMQNGKALEYMCPCCGEVNFLDIDCTKDMYKEKLEPCKCCKRILSLTAADGMLGRINLIVDTHDTERLLK